MVLQHRVGRLLSVMYTDVLLAANDHIFVPIRTADGVQQVRMSDAIDYPAAYAKLTDSIVRVIEYSGTNVLRAQHA